MQKNIMLAAGAAVAIAVGGLGLAGCMTQSTTSVTPASTNAVTGAVTASSTNTVTTVNQANLALDCAGLQLVGTPVLIYALQQDPSAVPITEDIQVAITGALDGANTNVIADIDGLIGNNAALQASLQPLIKGASALEQSELVKYGTNNAVIISEAILQADLNIVNAALAAVPTTTK